MPYIENPARYKFEEAIVELASRAETSGELNYIITCVCKEYLNKKGVSYTNMNEIVGVLECAKLEFYRRLTAPYEDDKAAENGDVY